MEFEINKDSYYSFRSEGRGGGTVHMTGEEDCWTEQADLFVRFLHAQGFVLSEKDLSDYYLQRAEEFGDLRSNKFESDYAARLD